MKKISLVVSTTLTHGLVEEKESNSSLGYTNKAFVAPDEKTIIAYANAKSTGYFELRIFYMGSKRVDIICRLAKTI